MKKLLICLLAAACFAGVTAAAQKRKKAQTDREYWVELLCKMSEPVLESMNRGELHRDMPVEYSPTWDGRPEGVAYMECFGRLMAGIAPWLALPDDGTPEGAKRKRLREWALASYAHAVNPESPDYLLWNQASQPLVDAAYIAQSFMRAPQALWEPLDAATKERYLKEFRELKRVAAPYNNWLLFRAMLEAFMLSVGEEYDAYVLNLAVRKMNEWYQGDGWYGDGPEFSLDYYNSYVIHPMLIDVIEAAESAGIRLPVSTELAVRRMQRYNILLERLISPEASFPAMGRSMTYRLAAFQTLSLAAWRYGLPEPLTDGQVRSALTAVMRRMFSVEGNFSEQGFLQLGFVGHQPELADYYTNTGSLYITSLVFLPLGLPADSPFWTAPAEDWTSRKAWSGKPFPKDYHRSVRQ